MTIIESYQQLLEYFNNHTIFNLKKNAKEIFLVSEDENAESAPILCALVLQALLMICAIN